MLLVVVTAAPLVALGSSGYCQSKNFAAIGGGGLSCAQFGEEYKRDPEDIEAIFFHWAQEMMSGVNMVLFARGKKMTNLAIWDTQHQREHIRIYCAGRPLVPYGRAVIDLYDTMRLQQKLPDWRR